MLKTGHTSARHSHITLAHVDHTPCWRVSDIAATLTTSVLAAACLQIDRLTSRFLTSCLSTCLSLTPVLSVQHFLNSFFTTFSLKCFGTFVVFLGGGGELCQQFKVSPRLLFLLRSQHAIASLDRLRKVRSRKIMNAPHSVDATLDECGAHTGTNRLPTR